MVSEVLITIVGIVLGIFVNSKSPDIYKQAASIEVRESKEVIL